MYLTEPSSLTDQGYNRHALVFGSQKINLHQLGREFEPKAQNVQAGSGDLCFLTDTPVEEVLKTFQEHKLEVRHFFAVFTSPKAVPRKGGRDRSIIFGACALWRRLMYNLGLGRGNDSQ